MERVLDVYGKDYDPENPVLCFDERPCQLIEDVLVPLPTEAGKDKREDYHYKRNGTCVVLLAIEPLKGKRFVEVRATKTKEDYASFMKNLRKQYSGAKKITLVQDNLNTHCASSFYKTFAAPEAFELMSSFEMVYTPKRASWLNMAEIEFSALSKQCLDRRIGSMNRLEKEVISWVKNRNEKEIKIHWQFTQNKARGKFERHYLNAKN